MSKRKIEDDAAEGPSRQRQRSQSRERLQHETEEPEKRVVLNRLFGRYCALNIQNNQARDRADDPDSDEELDENEDPLLDEVPAGMDPEQLGFLICTQETLRFLYERGYTAENPMFMRLRSRLLQGISDIAAA